MSIKCEPSENELQAMWEKFLYGDKKSAYDYLISKGWSLDTAEYWLNYMIDSRYSVVIGLF